MHLLNMGKYLNIWSPLIHVMFHINLPCLFPHIISNIHIMLLNYIMWLEQTVKLNKRVHQILIVVSLNMQSIILVFLFLNICYSYSQRQCVYDNPTSVNPKCIAWEWLFVTDWIKFRMEVTYIKCSSNVK
jgi:hypothetical protein